MPMILAFGAMTAEAAAASAAMATAAAAAAPVAASTTAAGLTAAGTAAAGAGAAGASAIPGIVGGVAPELLGAGAAGAAPTAGGIAAGTQAAQAMSPEIAANMTQAAAQNAGQAVNPAIQGGANPALTQAGPAPQIPQGIDQGLNVQSGVDPTITNNMPNGGFDAYGQFTQAPGSIDPAASQAAAPKPYINGPPSGGIGSPIDPNAGLLEGVDYAKMTGVDVPHAGEAATSGLEKGINSAMKFAKDNPLATTLGMQAVGTLLNSNSGSSGPPKKTYSRKGNMSGFQSSSPSTIEYNPIYQPTPYAEGGLAYGIGGSVEQMSAQNALSSNQMYPQSQLQTPMYSNPMVQRPVQNNVINSGIDTPVDPYSGEQRYAAGGTTTSSDASKRYAQMMGIQSAEQQKANEDYLQAFNKREMANSIHTDSDIDTAKQDPMHASMTRLKKIGKRVGIKPVELPKSAITDANVFHAAANGGIMHSLGGYSDGGRLLKGPGDGVSDSIPATIGDRQPARLADGEFVVPARIVSELGNGSTEAGARKLYQMMERIQADRKKSIGKNKVAVNSKAAKHLPK